MRYYDLKIIDPSSGKVVLRSTSYPGGLGGNGSGPSFLGVSAAGFGLPGLTTSNYDPGALNVQFDIIVQPAAQPVGGSTVTLFGVAQSFLTNGVNFANMQLELRGGMGPGLPLAKPQQAGLLFQGQIQQVYTNWTAGDLQLAFVINPSVYTMANPGNIVLNWTAGMPLSTALTNTFKVAYPSAAVQMNIDRIVQTHDEQHIASNLQSLATLIDDITSTNVQITAIGDVILVNDDTYNPPAIPLDFLDFVGQPTWIEPQIFMVACVMRADINIGDVIEFPQAANSGPNGLGGLVQTALSAVPSAINYQSAIKGKFKVVALRHIGNLRNPNGGEWVTIIKAAVITPTPPAPAGNVTIESITVQ